MAPTNLPSTSSDPTARGRGLLALSLAALAVASLAACSSDSLAEGVVEPVDVLDNSFRADSIEVAAGTEIVWENKGRNAHDILPVDGDGWGVEADRFQPDAEYRHRFTEPGTYDYYCSLHGTTTKGMVGTIVVTK